MESMRKEYPVGTIVFKTSSDNPLYGIVPDRDFWLEETAKENPDYVRNFLEHEEEKGEGFMIPIMIFGYTVSSKFVKVGRDLTEVRYVQKYTYSNVGGDIHIIDGGTKELLNIIWQVLMFFGKVASYHEDVKNDVKALEVYIAGNYNYESSKEPSFYKKMVQLYEKALPKKDLPLGFWQGYNWKHSPVPR